MTGVRERELSKVFWIIEIVCVCVRERDSKSLKIVTNTIYYVWVSAFLSDVFRMQKCLCEIMCDSLGIKEGS